MADLNPRAVRGDNTDSIDYAKEEVDRLGRDYAPLADTAVELETEFFKLFPEPTKPEIPDDTIKGRVVDFIKRARDYARRADSLREVEKAPHYRRGQGVDQFFFGLIDRVAKRERKNRDGLADLAQARLTAYDTRKLLEEQERLRKDAEEKARIAATAKAEEDRLAAIAEEARLKAERARTPETTAAKEEIAAKTEDAAGAARVDAIVAERAAEDAYVGTLQRPADIMRTRTAGGSLSTMQTEKFAEIEDAAKLNAAALWPYVAYAEKEKALRAWAKATGHSQQMDGAKIGDRPKSVVR